MNLRTFFHLKNVDDAEKIPADGKLIFSWRTCFDFFDPLGHRGTINETKNRKHVPSGENPPLELHTPRKYPAEISHSINGKLEFFQKKFQENFGEKSSERTINTR